MSVHEREPMPPLDEYDDTPTLLDSALDALWALTNHVPELWEDEVKDGFITLHVLADTLHEIERVLYVSEVD